MEVLPNIPGVAATRIQVIRNAGTRNATKRQIMLTGGSSDNKQSLNYLEKELGSTGPISTKD